MSTRYGKVFVTVQGDTTKTPFLTYPDIGLTCKRFLGLKLKKF